MLFGTQAMQTDYLGEKTMVENNNNRQQVIKSLTAAEVPEVIAIGIADVLAEAGFKQLAVRPYQASRPSLLLFPPIAKTLPALVLSHDQRIELPAQKRQHNMYAYTRLVAKSCQENVLILTPQDRVA